MQKKKRNQEGENTFFIRLWMSQFHLLHHYHHLQALQFLRMKKPMLKCQLQTTNIAHAKKNAHNYYH